MSDLWVPVDIKDANRLQSINLILSVILFPVLPLVAIAMIAGSVMAGHHPFTAWGYGPVRESND